MQDFEQVYRTYFTDVYRYVLSLCRNEGIAEEVTQQAFFKALQAIGGFRGECRLYVWLCQIAKNEYYTWLRKNRGGEPAEDCVENLEHKLLRRETAFAVHKALHALPEPYKEVFSLRLFGELPFAQIGQLFGKTESWARVTYHRARLKLKEELQDEAEL
ncbi:RNA polymerase sigma factor [Agathobaculum sp. Marseille-P7918]|uniref:RNA polymerase sigma factor n=1 Tax=Agathobaculum sp. Marseille-P7918 TaxID=2479843 RepID=UPI0035675685